MPESADDLRCLADPLQSVPAKTSYTEVEPDRSGEMSCEFKVVKSPVGKLKLVARDNKLVAILWENDRPNRVKLGDMREADDSRVLVETARQLDEYFAGKRTRFDLDIEFVGTEFQKKVWAALLTIPAKRAAMATSPDRSATAARSGRWVRRTAATRSRSSRRAIA
jgi:hypothetical protein